MIFTKYSHETFNESLIEKSTMKTVLKGYKFLTLYVIVLEKRDHFAVKLFSQYKQIKVDTQLGFVHNSECLN